MTLLLNGMIQHSDLVMLNFSDGFPLAENELGPFIDAWNGRVWAGFDFDTLAALLASVEWRSEEAVTVILELPEGWKVFNLAQFHKWAMVDRKA